MNLPALLLAALLALCLPGCDGIFLSSSEVGNPPAKGAVAGALMDESGSPAAGALVRLYPVNFDPVRDSASAKVLAWRDTADAEGAFTLSGVDTGLYNVQASDARRGTTVLLRGVRVLKNRTAQARSGMLKPPGAIVLTLPDLPSGGTTYVYIAGTGVFTRLDPAARENPTVTLEGVPVGLTPEIRYRTSSESGDTLIAREIQVMSGDVVPAQVHADWAHRMRIFMNASPSGIGATGDVQHFTVPVRLGKGGQPFDFSQAARDGRDLRFTDSAGGPLKFEIESWDSAGGAALVWVCAGTMEGGRSDQFMRMFWGKPDAATLSQPAFSSDLGFVGIWHMDRQDNNRVMDASDGTNPLNVIGTAPAYLEAAGMLGRHAVLDGRDRQFNAIQGFAPPHEFSLSLWFNTTTDSGGKLIGFGVVPGLTDTSRDRHVWMDDTGQVHFGVYPNQGTAPFRKAVLTAPGRWNDGTWHHLAAVLSPSAGLSLHLDGRKVAEDTTVRSAQVYAATTGYWRVGYDFDLYDWPFRPSALYFKGALDEVRVCQKAQGSERIRLEYESQRQGGRFLRYESEAP